KELSPKQLRVTCELDHFECRTSDELVPLQEIVGQKRAIRALEFGLEIEDLGFNVYVAGIPGTGRTTAIMGFLEELAVKELKPSDWCYVSNFKDQYQPRALELPAGKGRQLDSDLNLFIESARSAITQMLESEEYAHQREERTRVFEAERDKLSERMQQKAAKAGFVLQGTQTGLLMVPVVEGKPVTPDKVAGLPASVRKEIESRRDVLEEDLRSLFRKVRSLERRMRKDLQKMEEDAVQFRLEPLIDELEENYANFSKVIEFIHAMAKDIGEHLNQFIGRLPPGMPSAQSAKQISPDEFAKRYRANLVVDNADLKGAPVVIAHNPTYSNLFGRIEKESRFGALVTDFSMIRPGALHKVNGGYLVIPIRDLLLSPLSYQALKRALQNEQIVIEEPSEQMGFLTVKTLRPEPIPLKVKVIIVGDPLLYQQLYTLDPDFRELFKVKADFDTTMDRTRKNVKIYGSFICALHKKEKLRPLTVSAIAEVIDYSSRLAGDQSKLSTRFSIIADIIREANLYAKRARKRTINRKHIKRALEERIYRSNLLEEKIRELIEKEVILIDTRGKAIGQVNGLSVLSLGDFSFGRPSRVTASVAPGRGKVIDIEREAKLGGPIHTKGILILSGYVAENFGRNKPLSLSARLVFEQSYSGVDGDSASSTELYALLSVLSGVPIQQRFAVTGSVNQHGEVQAIGGVNEKIEGYFALCKTVGLTGNQSVIIPKANIQNLMLKDEVVEAVRKGKFHIFAIETIDEGIELLTGIPAGKRKSDGNFPSGTINDLVDKRLKQMATTMREYTSASSENERD
ncbi:MAG: Lon protease family protein, partial [Promethearchaeota archaeon]